MRADQQLASGPFGSSVGLLWDVDCYYRGVGEILGVEPPRPLDERSSFHDAVAHVVQRSTLNEALASPAEPSSGPAMTSTTRSIVAEVTQSHPDRPLWVTNLAGADLVSASLRDRASLSLMSSNLEEFAPGRLTADGVDVLLGAIRLLESAMPEIASVTLPFVHLLVIHEAEIESMQISRVPASSFFSISLLSQPSARVAEAVLHEALHEKSILLRLCRRLMRPGYSEHAGPAVELPWRTAPPRAFGAWRLLSAAHVYVHLLHFRRAVGSADFHEAADRARFLCDALGSPTIGRDLGSDGHEIVAWLRSMV